MPTTFAPTKNRGAALAREILTVIETEIEAEAFQRALGKTNRWQQSTWAEVSNNELPPGTKAELIGPDIVSGRFRSEHWGSTNQPLMAFDNGLTCGTAMCFAGHAAHLAGDRMVATVNNAISGLAPEHGKFHVKSVIARWRRKRGYDMSFSPNWNTDFVLVDGQSGLTRISDRARNLLGLTKAEANTMFEASNDLIRLRRYVEDMEAGINLVTRKKKRRTAR